MKTSQPTAAGGVEGAVLAVGQLGAKTHRADALGKAQVGLLDPLRQDEAEVGGQRAVEGQELDAVLGRIAATAQP